MEPHKTTSHQLSLQVNHSRHITPFYNERLLLRWHREGNYCVGGRIRKLDRYRNVTDVETLALKFPLSEAQEIVALEAGYSSWAALKTGSVSKSISCMAIRLSTAL
jgi:hypothetical protein